MSNKEIMIGKNKIGNNFPVYFIAELSANHNQDYDLAVKTIQAMKDAGADAVKLQTYTADTITIPAKNRYFKINQNTIWDGTTLHELYQQAYTPWEWQPKLKKIANSLGMDLFSSAFDFSSVDFLEKMNVPAYKIASFEINDIPLIKYVAKKKKPIILSTGIARKSDIKLALEACYKEGNFDIALLRCTSTYPTPPEEANLLTIPDLKKKFKTIIGLSDHGRSSEVPIAAVALGAKIIEKHFILDRNIGGPDASFSLEPDEFKNMTEAVRTTEKVLGKTTYTLSQKQKNSREHSRSLFIVEDIKKGEKFTKKNIRSIRPGFGIHTRYYYEVLGLESRQDIQRGTPLKKRHFK